MFSYELEKSVLSKVLTNREAMLRCVDSLTENDFHVRDNRIVFKAVKSCCEKNIVPDIVTIKDITKDDNIQFLDIYKADVILGDLSTHINKLCEYRKRRNLLEYSTLVSDTAKDKATPIDDVFTKLSENLNIINQDSSSAITHCGEYAKDGAEGLHEKSSYIKSGIQQLDDCIYGLGSGQLILIGARPGMGKTSLALNISQNVAAHKPVLFYSFEMLAIDLTHRVLSAMANVESWKIKFGKMDDDERLRVDKAIEKYKLFKLYFADRLNLDKMVNSIKSFHIREPIGLVVVDYLQLVLSETKERRDLEVGNISRTLKNIALDLKIPVLALSQLNRALEYRQNKCPMLADLKESGSIEQDSDIVMFIHQEEGEKNTNIIIAKHRNGRIDRFYLRFDKKYTKFTDPAKLFGETWEA